MKLQIVDFDIDIMEFRRPRRGFPVRGWYWQDIRLPPRGPFDTVGEALRHLTAEIESGRLKTAVDAKAAARRGAGSSPSLTCRPLGKN